MGWVTAHLLTLPYLHPPATLVSPFIPPPGHTFQPLHTSTHTVDGRGTTLASCSGCISSVQLLANFRNNSALPTIDGSTRSTAVGGCETRVETVDV